MGNGDQPGQSDDGQDDAQRRSGDESGQRSSDDRAHQQRQPEREPRRSPRNQQQNQHGQQPPQNRRRPQRGSEQPPQQGSHQPQAPPPQNQGQPHQHTGQQQPHPQGQPPHGQPQAGTAQSFIGGLSTAEKLVFAGVIITVIAAFLPWVTVSAGGESESVSGFDGGDGVITIIAAVVAAGVVYWRSLDIAAMVVTGLLGLVVVGLGLLYINDPGYGAQALFASPTYEAEIGLYLTAVGGATMLGGVGKQAIELQ